MDDSYHPIAHSKDLIHLNNRFLNQLQLIFHDVTIKMEEDNQDDA